MNIFSLVETKKHLDGIKAAQGDMAVSDALARILNAPPNSTVDLGRLTDSILPDQTSSVVPNFPLPTVHLDLGDPGQTALIGSILGAVTGVGAAADDPNERSLPKAAKGALVGGILGFATPFLLDSFKQIAAGMQ